MRGNPLPDAHDDYDEPSEDGVDDNTADHLTDEVQAVYFMKEQKAVAWLARWEDNPAMWSLYVEDSMRQLQHQGSYEGCIIALESMSPVRIVKHSIVNLS